MSRIVCAPFAALLLLFIGCTHADQKPTDPLYQHIGYIEHLSKENTQWKLELDPIEWFGTPADAERAYRQDNPECDQTNSCATSQGYYIRNREAHILTFTVSKDTKAWMHDDEEITWQMFVKRMNDGTGQVTQNFSAIPFWIHTESGAVTMIREQYIP